MINNRFIWSCYEWKISVHVPYLLFVCFAVTLCLLLAFWQWQRAQTADLRYSAYQQQVSQPASALSAAPPDFQRVSVVGAIRKVFFLDNQIYQGVAGRHVLAEVETQQSLLLVNLGWQDNQSPLLQPDQLPQYIEVEGLLKKPQPGFLLQSAQQDPHWPQLMQQIQISLLNDYYGYQLSPYVLYSETVVAGLIPATITMKNKFYMHIGYTVQWLIIASVCVGGFIYYCRIEHTENEAN